MLRVKCIAGIAVGLLAGMATFASPARATTLITTLETIIPGNPVIPGDLIGTPQFWAISPDFDPLSLIPGNPVIGPLSGDQTFSFFPPDPCLGRTSCQIAFSFSGTVGGTVSAFAYEANTNLANLILPSSAPMILIANLEPPDPCFTGAACQASGPIIAFDQAVQIGTWDVTISETPLPAALPLFATGLGVMGLLGWRRKRKNAASLSSSGQGRLPESLHFAESTVILGVVRARSVHKVGYGHNCNWAAA